jgi:putative DNA primase/helicase
VLNVDNINYLLQVLILFANWVTWKYEWVIAPGKEPQLKKPPISLRGSKRNPWVPANWCPYPAWLGPCGNLGFFLTKTCYLICIDLDGKKYTPAMYDLHRRILEDFQDTYIEYSPSGRGVHIWLYGWFDNAQLRQMGWKHKFDELGVEFYCSARYMTVTLNPLPGHNIPLTNGAERVARWIAECNPQTGKTETCKPPKRTETGEQPVPDAPDMPTGVCGVWGGVGWCDCRLCCGGAQYLHALAAEPLTLADEIICTKAAYAANGEKFKKLWLGKLEELPYGGDESKADQALCNILAFYCMRNGCGINERMQVAKLFLHSQLGKRRKIFDHRTYLCTTTKRSFDRKPIRGGAR